MKRIYVASKWALKHPVRDLISALDGYEVTYDWTKDVTNLHGLDKFKAASHDLVGVRLADMLIQIVPESGGCGMFVEMGFAIGMGIPVYQIGYQELDGYYEFCLPTDRSVFDALCIQVGSIPQLIRRIH